MTTTPRATSMFSPFSRTGSAAACTRLLILLLLLACPMQGFGMGSSGGGKGRAGLQILTIWEEGTDERIPVYVWYPTIRPERPSFLEPYTVRVAREGQPEEGRFPIVLISHATAESGLSHHTMAEFLARHGYMVIAPTHPGDNFLDTARIFTERQVVERPRNMIQALDAVLSNEQLGPIADAGRISIIGYGTGATAALLLAGAVPNTTGLRSYCDAADQNDPYCSHWAQERLASLMTKPKGVLAPAQDKPWHDPRIRSVALIAPGYAMLFDAESFAGFSTPAMIIEAERDRLNPPALHAQHLREVMPPDTPYFILKDATSFMLHAPCNERMQANYPAICKDPAGTNRRDIHDTLHDILLRFISHTQDPD